MSSYRQTRLSLTRLMLAEEAEILVGSAPNKLIAVCRYLIRTTVLILTALVYGVHRLLCCGSATLEPDEVSIPDPGPRCEYVEDSNGHEHLVTVWNPGDEEDGGRYNPDKHNVYHLFTRKNPTVSQPLRLGTDDVLRISNFNPQNRTVLLLHGWIANVTADFNTVLVSAFLAAGDVNVLAVDWSVGADTANYLAALSNTRTGGASAARFITWVNTMTGADIGNYHIVGYSLGAHLAGVIGRNLGGKIGYITALDPALLGFIFNSDRLRSTDAVYTEVIHTNAGLLGYPSNLGHADFYPNGGINMPGSTSQTTDHSRSYLYFAESLVSGGFTGKPCRSYIKAMRGKSRKEADNLRMGGLLPKTGCSGIFHLKTNPQPPFSRG